MISVNLHSVESVVCSSIRDHKDYHARTITIVSREKPDSEPLSLEITLFAKNIDALI